MRVLIHPRTITADDKELRVRVAEALETALGPVRSSPPLGRRVPDRRERPQGRAGQAVPGRGPPPDRPAGRGEPDGPGPGGGRRRGRGPVPPVDPEPPEAAAATAGGGPWRRERGFSRPPGPASAGGPQPSR